MIPEGEVGCTFCDKSIYRIFVEHIKAHLMEKKFKVRERDVNLIRDWWKRHEYEDAYVMTLNEYYTLDRILTLVERHFK